ncbi:MAG: hypothetical protein HN420_16690, partial [Rhodospirillaceae bacterium]|nr:hypothetical protein [Rhodospirillaceae bacterium]
MADGTATGDSLLVEASADIETIRKGVFGYDPDQAFVITVTTTLQQRSRSYEVWETRAEGGPIRDRVAAIPSGM